MPQTAIGARKPTLVGGVGAGCRLTGGRRGGVGLGKRRARQTHKTRRNAIKSANASTPASLTEIPCDSCLPSWRLKRRSYAVRLLQRKPPIAIDHRVWMLMRRHSARLRPVARKDSDIYSQLPIHESPAASLHPWMATSGVGMLSAPYSRITPPLLTSRCTSLFPAS